MSHRRLTDEQKAEQDKRFDKIIDSFIEETTSSEEVKPSPSKERPRLKNLDDVFK